MCTAVGLIRVVLAVIVPVTDVGWVGADACATLELARSALELSYGDKTQHIIKQNKQQQTATTIIIMIVVVWLQSALTAVCRLI